MKVKKEIDEGQAMSLVADVMTMNFSHCHASLALLDKVLVALRRQAYDLRGEDPLSRWEDVIDAITGINILHGYDRSNEQEVYLIDVIEEEDRIGLVYSGQFTHGRVVGVFLHRETGKFSLELCTGTGKPSTYFSHFSALRDSAPEACNL